MASMSKRILLTASVVLVALSGCGIFDATEEGVTVEAYTGPPLEAARTPRWTVLSTEPDGTVTLTFTYRPETVTAYMGGNVRGIRPGHTAFLTLRSGGDGLPEFEELWIGVVNEGGRHLREGTIRIQDWEPDGTLSGRIEGAMDGNRVRVLEIDFWAEAE